MRSDDEPTTEMALHEVIDFQEGPGIMARDFRATGVPLIRLAGLSSDSLLAGCNYLDEQMVERKWSHFRLRVGDTLLSTSASLGRIARVSDEAEGAIPYTGIIRMRPRDRRLDPDFIQYVLEAPDFQGQVEAMGAGSVMRHFGPSHLRSMTLTYPRRPEQERIALVLGALDDKIDSNGRLTDLLLASLSAAFRHRVSELDPASCTATGLTAIARFVNGRAFTKHANNRGRPILRIKELNSGVTGVTLLSDIDAQDENIARHHDILFSWSGSLDVYRWHGPESLINQHIFKVLPEEGCPAWFVVGWIREHLLEFQAIARDKATTMGHIKREHLKTAAVTIPSDEVLSELDAVLSPLDDQVATLAAETRTLETVRDALLPKLISGEIRVPDSADPDEVIGPAAEATATSAA